MTSAAIAQATNELRDLPRDEDGPVFREPWEAQAFAMALSLHERGLFTWSEWAAALADEIKIAQAGGDPDTGTTYYRHWLATLEKLVAAKGVATLGNPASLPRCLGPCRRPHAAWQADRTEAGGFSASGLSEGPWISRDIALFRWDERASCGIQSGRSPFLVQHDPFPRYFPPDRDHGTAPNAHNGLSVGP